MHNATPATTAPVAVPSHFGWRAGWRYGLMGLPLAFVALPLYVVLPNYYARNFGVPLALLGAILLGARLFDALTDPLLGRWSDALFARSTRAVLGWAGGAAMLLGLGFALLFFPPVRELSQLAMWATLCLMLTYTAFSLLSIMHQSWGAMLGGDEVQRSRVVAWREGLGLVGIILAAVLPVALGLPATTLVFFVALAAGWLAWRGARRPTRPLAQKDQPKIPLWLAFTRPGFSPLLAVFMVNGIASAVPATLILFFVQDRLQAPATTEPLFLGSYFLSAALAIPLWLRLVKSLGLARTWGVGMLLSIVVFVFAAQLGTGDITAFVIVCIFSGVALGTDLALPSALLAGIIARNGDQGRLEGAYFGWWNFATKLNLALAAGVALPVLGLLGYVPGNRDEAALQTLTWAYCLLPCALKAIAAGLLYLLVLRRKTTS
jgi:GPH family glycoside/pentoside/hexuronide:cation symporter